MLLVLRDPFSLRSLTLAPNGAPAAWRYASLLLPALRLGNGDSLDDTCSERGCVDVGCGHGTPDERTR